MCAICVSVIITSSVVISSVTHLYFQCRSFRYYAHYQLPFLISFGILYHFCFIVNDFDFFKCVRNRYINIFARFNHAHPVIMRVKACLLGYHIVFFTKHTDFAVCFEHSDIVARRFQSRLAVFQLVCFGLSFANLKP